MKRIKRISNRILVQGKFRPKNPEKYKGDPTNIIYRSSWELQMCKWCDANPNVKQWMSEGTIVPYRSKLDGRMHRYYVDFTVQFTNGQTVLFEIKPLKQTMNMNTW